MFRHLRVSAAVLCAFPLVAFAANDPWNAPFTLQIGALDTKAETSVRLDSNNGRLGTSLTFEGDLGVDEKKAVPTFDMSWRINPYHGTVLPARARAPSSHTRSIVAVRGCSVDWMVRSTA